MNLAELDMAVAETMEAIREHSGGNLYSVTFGSRYAYEDHPAGDWVTPNGWLVVAADSEREAREMLFDHLDRGWAFLYTGAVPGRAEDVVFWYPKGPIAHLTTAGLVVKGQEPTLREKLVAAIVATLQDPEGAGSDLPGDWQEEHAQFMVHDAGGYAGGLDVGRLANDMIRFFENEYRKGTFPS